MHNGEIVVQWADKHPEVDIYVVDNGESYDFHMAEISTKKRIDESIPYNHLEVFGFESFLDILLHRLNKEK